MDPEEVKNAARNYRLIKFRCLNVMMALAITLADARSMFPSDQAFSSWLVEHELDRISPEDRKALINIGTYPDISRRVLRSRVSRSLERIWRKEILPVLSREGVL
jgi:hypothetical protein